MTISVRNCSPRMVGSYVSDLLSCAGEHYRTDWHAKEGCMRKHNLKFMLAHAIFFFIPEKIAS